MYPKPAPVRLVDGLRVNPPHAHLNVAHRLIEIHVHLDHVACCTRHVSPPQRVGKPIRLVRPLRLKGLHIARRRGRKAPVKNRRENRCPLSSRDWSTLLEYTLFPPAIGPPSRNIPTAIVYCYFVYYLIRAGGRIEFSSDEMA
eukprot:1180667-Prorocentrum_minimum.AAC.1